MTQGVETSDDRVSFSDDEDEDEENAWIDDFVASWRQHCIAVIVAVSATVLAYYYQKLAGGISVIASKRVKRLMLAPTTLEDLHQKQQQQPHSHLHQYRRTANVSFCGMATPIATELAVMDFNVPNSLIPSMALHFQDDWLHDDEAYPSGEQHPETLCMDRLERTSQQKFIKGVTFYYKAPGLGSMYREQLGSEVDPLAKRKKIQAVLLTFTGFAAKFVNMGVVPILLYWDGRGGDDRNRRFVGEIAPFEAITTATRPGESFSVSPVYDHSHALDRWVVTADDAVQYYEPGNAKPLTGTDERLYRTQKLNQEFAKHYLMNSGRSWLSHFPRAFPGHHMWKAEYFGQKYIVSSTIVDDGDNERPQNYKLEVVSVTPRVFTIRNFLSATKCDSLIQMAISNDLEASTVYAGSLAKQHRDIYTRSSTNTWLTRDTANVTEEIYRRAAHLINIDESLLQAPIDDDVDAHHHSIAESLQVIRYKAREQYAPHHDWVLPSQQHRYQPTRFATLLLYLNDNFEGGQTIFPRAVNSQFHEGIQIKPEKGMAVLFYNVLPDGNVDDLSIVSTLHACFSHVAMQLIRYCLHSCSTAANRL